MGRGLLAAQFRGGLWQEARRLTYSTCPVSWRRSSPKAFPGDVRPPSEPRIEHSKPQRVWWEGRQEALCVACTCPEGPSPWVLRLSVTKEGGQEQRLAGRVLVRAGPRPDDLSPYCRLLSERAAHRRQGWEPWEARGHVLRAAGDRKPRNRLPAGSDSSEHYAEPWVWRARVLLEGPGLPAAK